MFSNKNRPNTRISLNSPNSRDNGTIPASWGEFSKKLYFYRDVREDAANANRRSPISKVWIYVGIALTYLLLIGIVVAVLILAPKYPSYYHASPGFHPLPLPIAPPLPAPPPPSPIGVGEYSDDNDIVQVVGPQLAVEDIAEDLGPDLNQLNLPILQIVPEQELSELFQLEEPLQVGGLGPIRPSPRDEFLVYDLIQPRSGITEIEIEVNTDDSDSGKPTQRSRQASTSP